LPAGGGIARTVPPLSASIRDVPEPLPTAARSPNGRSRTRGPSTAEIARRLDVKPATLRRWVRDGVVPMADGAWTPPAIAHARLVARLRARGHSLGELREASSTGRLAYGYVEDLFPEPEETRTLEEASRACGMPPALIERIWRAAGLSVASLDAISDEDVELLTTMGAVIDAGFPLVAFLQLVAVYGQALAAIADAEVKLFHLYVHEPMMRDGRTGLEIAEAMEHLASDLLPLAGPVMERLHQRALEHFVGQDVVGHLEAEGEGAELGRVRVTIAFADLAGYTRLTEEAGEQEALDVVERFVDAVQISLPSDARVIKTIGDAVMVVGSDAASLVDWAVGFQRLYGADRPLPRIGLHCGPALYREGDYYGRAVNLAARVGARAAGGEVLCTETVVEAAGSHLEFDHIGEVRLKGFNEATDLFLARPVGER
jgi:adenylate cyclase